MDTDGFIVCIKLKDIYVDIAKVVCNNTSNYELDRLLLREKN